MTILKRIYEQTHGEPPDRACFKGSDEKWEGYLLGVEEAGRVAETEVERLRALADDRLNLLRAERSGFEAEVERLRYAIALAAAWLPGPERATVLDQARMTEDEAARLSAS